MEISSTLLLALLLSASIFYKITVLQSNLTMLSLMMSTFMSFKKTFLISFLGAWLFYLFQIYNLSGTVVGDLELQKIRYNSGDFFLPYHFHGHHPGLTTCSLIPLGHRSHCQYHRDLTDSETVLLPNHQPSSLTLSFPDLVSQELFLQPLPFQHAQFSKHSLNTNLTVGKEKVVWTNQFGSYEEQGLKVDYTIYELWDFGSHFSFLFPHL